MRNRGRQTVRLHQWLGIGTFLALVLVGPTLLAGDQLDDSAEFTQALRIQMQSDEVIDLTPYAAAPAPLPFGTRPSANANGAGVFEAGSYGRHPESDRAGCFLGVSAAWCGRDSASGICLSGGDSGHSFSATGALLASPTRGSFDERGFSFLVARVTLNGPSVLYIHRGHGRCGTPTELSALEQLK